MPYPDDQQGGIWWPRLELATLVIGAVVATALSLANYSWHVFKESLFYMAWSAMPFGLLLLGSHLARMVVRSPRLPPVTALLAFALTVSSLLVYLDAVLNPNHSSGMVFFILPLASLIAVPVVLAGVVFGFLAASSGRRLDK